MKAIQISFLLLLICFINCDSSDICHTYFELMVSDDCKNVFSNATHGCLYTGNKCELRFKGCSSYTGTDKSVCANRVPDNAFENAYHKCELVGNKCEDVLKKCSDYEEGITDCEKLKAEEDNQRCILNNNRCESHYKTCSLSGKDQQTCEKNIPSDKSLECVWEGSVCNEKPKKCKETKFYNDDDCYGLEVTDSKNQICLGSDDGCKEQYKTCELYNEKVSNKKREECESLRYDGKNNYKCFFKDGACSTGTKCSDFTYESGCKGFIPSDTDKKCSFINGVCKEIYKTCELYDTKTKIDDKKEADCKEIKEYDNSGYYKCVFDTDKKSCGKQKLTKCDHYETGMDESYCYNIYLNDYKQCTIKDNKCVEIFTGCPRTAEKLSKENCEAIDLGNYYYFCRYNEKDNGCYERLKDCSLGKDESSCKSIVLYKEDVGRVYTKKSAKCVWEKDSCVENPKVCGDAQNAAECSLINPTSSNKKCIYLNGQCKEQYEDCNAYNKNGKETIEQNVCESIVLGDTSYKCTFKSGNPNECVQEKKYSTCSEFKKDDYEYVCTSYGSNPPISLSIDYKCAYSNSACSEVQKNCLELSNEPKVDEEICESAPTSGNNKYCSLKADKSGCEEKEKENADNKGNFGLCYKKLWFNLLIIVFGLLL